MNIPDYCEAITAYRCWNVYANGLLTGQHHHEPWEPYAPFVGRCSEANAAHLVDGRFVAAPVLACDCGVHALLSEADAEARAALGPGVNYLKSWGGHAPNGTTVVWGAVKLWGRVIVHELGYRAEFAYPSQLLCENGTIARAVEALYGVPCTVKALPMQKFESDTWWLSPSFISYAPMSVGSHTFYNYYTTPTPTPPVSAPTPAPAGLLKIASLAQIDKFHASRYDRQRARQELRGAQRGGKNDWQAVMYRAFHASTRSALIVKAIAGNNILDTSLSGVYRDPGR